VDEVEVHYAAKRLVVQIEERRVVRRGRIRAVAADGIHEDIYASKLGEDRIARRTHAGFAGYVHCDSRGVDAFGGGFRAVRVRAGDHAGGARPRETGGDCVAERAGAARHHGYLAVQA
jgi:hypothetical protein